MEIDAGHSQVLTKKSSSKVRLFSGLFLFFLPLIVSGQAHSRYLRIIPQGDSSYFKKNIHYSNHYSTSEEKNKILDEVLLNLYGGAYLTAYLGRAITDSTGTVIYLNTGERFYWAQLQPGNADEGWLSAVGYRMKVYRNSLFSYKQVNGLLDKLLTYAENNGYPFASARLTDIQIKKGGIRADIHLDKGKRILWDSIEVVGDNDTAIGRDFLRAYLGIYPGHPYSEKTARQISTRLRELLYIRVVREPEIIFENSKATLRLYIEPQKANRLDGVLGLAPNSSKNNRFLLTGEFNLGLANILQQGIGLTLGYKSFLQSAQQINVNIQYPYILGLPFGISEDFNLMKFDTSYYILDNQIGISYYLTARDFIRLSYENYTTHLLNPEAYVKTKALPPYLDVSTDWYGLGIQSDRLDYKYNPRKGFSLHLEAATGVKAVTKNSRLDESLYDSIRLHKIVYRFRMDASVFIPFGRNSTINLGLLSSLLADNEIMENQLFRIGGLHDLRGFDEQSILASTYYIPRIEYRYLIDRNSNFQAFFNMAYYEERTRQIYRHDTPMGMGLGYNYLTKVGLFSISFAVGKQYENPFDFNAAKVHIGYLNRF